MIVRYIDRNALGYWVHVADRGDDVDEPFHLQYGPYRWGVSALFRYWFGTAVAVNDAGRAWP